MSLEKLAPALVAALRELTDPVKDGKAIVKTDRATYGYTYMSLPQLLAEVRPVLGAHGLCVIQQTETSERGVGVGTTIVHESGETLEFPILFIRCNQDAQSIGSAITYARRYQLGAALGLAGSDDDDGDHATQQQRAQRQEYAQTRPVTRTHPVAGEVDPWAGSGPTGTTEPPPATPVAPPERPDLGSPSTTTLASEKSRKMMWALLRKTGMDADQIRDWVAAVLTRDNDWHTEQLTQFEVSTIIDRLKAEDPA